MKKTVISLSVVLAMVILSEGLLFNKYRTTRNELLHSRQAAESSNEKTLQMDQKIFQLKDRIIRNEKQIQELEIGKKQITELQDDIRSKDKILSDYLKKLQISTENFRQEQKKTESLHNELSLKDQYVSKLQKQIEDVDALASSLKESLAAAQTQRDAFRDLSVTVTGQNENLRDRMEQMTSSHEAAVTGLREALQSREARIELLLGLMGEAESVIESLKTQLSSDQTRISALLNRTRDLTETRDRLENELINQKTGYAAKISELEKGQQMRDQKILSFKRQRVEADSRLESLQENLSLSRDSMADLQEKILGLENTEASLNTQIVVLKSGHDTAVSGLREAVQHREARIESLLGLMGEAESVIESLKTQLSSDQTRISTLLNRTRDLTETRGRLENEFNEQKSGYEAKISGLETGLQMRDQQILDSRRQKVEAENRLESLRENLAVSRNSMADLQEKIQGLEKTEASLNKQIVELKSSHEAAVNELREALQTREARIESLLGLMGDAESVIESLKTQLSSDQTSISTLLSRTRDLTETRDRLENALINQKTGYEARITELETDLQMRDQKILDFRRQGVEADNRLQSLRETLSLSRDSMADLQEKILGFKKTEASLSTQIVELKSGHDAAVTELRETLQSREARIELLQDEFKKAGVQIQSLEKINASLHKEVSGRNHQVLTMTRELDVLKGEFEQQRADCSGEVSDLNEALLVENVKIRDLEKQIMADADEIRSLKEKLLSNGSEAESLQSEILRLQGEKVRLEADYENKESVNTELISNLREEMGNREDTIRMLRDKLDRVEELALSLEKEIKEGQSRQNQVQNLLSELRQKEGALKTKVHRLQSEYNDMISGFKNEIDKREVTIQKLEEKLSITFVDHILFDIGKSTISPQGIKILDKVGTVFENIQNRKIRVIGHTDNIPIEETYRHIFPTNWELSSARAAAVVRYFQYKAGLDPIDMEVVGRSFYDPVATNETEAGRSKNRRVNIVIAPKLE